MLRTVLTGPVHAILLVALVVLTAVGFVLIPLDQPLPIHWNIFGAPDRFAPAWLALLVPLVVVAILLLVMALVDRLQSPAHRQAGLAIRDAAVLGVTAMMLILLAITIIIGLGGTVEVPRIVVLGIALLFVLLGNALPKSRRNLFAGIRLASSLSDDANWLATHRLAGLLFIVAGLALALFALLVGDSVALFVAAVVAALVPTLVAIVFSARHGRRS